MSEMPDKCVHGFYRCSTCRVGSVPKYEIMGQECGMADIFQGSVIDRAVANSPPPLDDVGEDVFAMLDEKDPLLVERGKTHGRFEDTAAVGQALRNMYRGRPGWGQLTDMQREALDMIAGKISRILSGQGGFRDHWDDIAGYAKIALGTTETAGS